MSVMVTLSIVSPGMHNYCNCLCKHLIFSIYWVSYRIDRHNQNVIIPFTSLYYSVLTTKRMEECVKNRMLAGRKREAQAKDRFLIPLIVPNPWGQGRELDKRNIVQAILGDTPLLTYGNNKDSQNMDQYLKKLEPSSLQIPDLVSQACFMPEEGPVLDFLTVFTEAKDDSWGFPRLKLLKNLQANRGPSYTLLETCRVREIVIGQTSDEKN